MFSIKDLIQSRQGEQLGLHENINPQFAKVLTTIGFDKTWVKAEGVSLFDDQGDEYFDFLSGYGVYAFGRNHPVIKKAIQDYLDLDFSNLIQMEAPLLPGLLAEKLLEKFGQGVREKVFFTSTGTEAVEAALKFAKAATGRDSFLCLDHAFHGLTTGSLSVNGNKEFRDGFGELLPSDKIAMNDLDALEAKLKTEKYAGFIFEPIQGKGIFLPEREFLQKAIELCKKYGTLSIADEIQAGLGRTSKWLASEHFDVKADMVTLSKALSGGMVQIGALLYPNWVYDKVFSRMDRCVVHSSTFGKNNLGMVCGLASLAILENENLLENAQKQGDYLISELNKLKDKHEWISEIRGKGLMVGIEFGVPKSFSKKLVWDAVHKIDRGLFAELIVMPLFQKHKILTQVSGHHQDIIKLIPPLTIDKSHIDHFITSLDDVLNNCSKVTGPILKMGANLAKHVVKAS